MLSGMKAKSIKDIISIFSPVLLALSTFIFTPFFRTNDDLFIKKNVFVNKSDLVFSMNFMGEIYRALDFLRFIDGYNYLLL